MKLKGINPFEQHVEKIIIGGCGVAFAGALAWQFFFSETDVKVGKDSVPVSRAFEPAEKEAKNKLGAMDDPNPKNLPELPKIDLGGSLALGNKLKLPDAAGTTVAMGRTPGLSGGTVPVPTTQCSFAIAKVPAPTTPYALAFRNTVNPVEKLRSAELAKLLPAEQPLDKAAVSVEAEVDGKAVFASLMADPDGDGPLCGTLPNWVLDNGAPLVEVVGVQLERRTVRKPDGSIPSSDEIVPIGVIPGRADPVAYWKQNATSAGDVPPLLDQAREAMEEILHPPYLETIAGVEWSPPHEMADELLPQAGNNAGAQIAAIKREIKRVDRKIMELGGGRRADRGAGGPPPPPGGGGRPGAGPRTGPSSGNRDEGRGNEPSGQAAQIEAAKKANLERLRKRRDDLSKRLRDLGDKSQAAGPSESAVAPAPLFENSKMKVWAHDVTVEPGAVYQYRVRVVVNNPLFDRALQPEQAELAKQQLIEGAWSDWTTQVDVGRDRYFFITNADSRDGVSGRPRATTDLFVFYYGYYRNGTASVEAGDAMNSKATLPELLLADMNALDAAFRNPQNNGDVPPLDPIKRDEAPQTGTGPGPRPTGPTGRDNPANKPADPIMTVAAPKELPLPVDAILMDVVAALGQTGGGQQRFDVTFRDQTGALVTVSPDKDRSRPEYKLVEASARAGKDQGKAPPPEVEEDLTLPPPKKERPSGPPPGGGGGGG